MLSAAEMAWPTLSRRKCGSQRDARSHRTGGDQQALGRHIESVKESAPRIHCARERLATAATKRTAMAWHQILPAHL